MELYHSEIRLPDGFVAPKGRVRLAWSSHAEEARLNDRYGEIKRFETATLDNLDVVEVGITGSKVAKILFRGQMDSNRDLCMVLIPNGRSAWLVKTVWVNLRTDKHRTLDRSKYVK